VSRAGLVRLGGWLAGLLLLALALALAGVLLSGDLVLRRRGVRRPVVVLASSSSDRLGKRSERRWHVRSDARSVWCGSVWTELRYGALVACAVLFRCCAGGYF
jgi:hypothetical protein